MLPVIDFTAHPLYQDFCNIFTNEQRISFVKEYRNMKLVQSDFSQLPDSPVNKQVWAEYRQKLRDITDTYDGTTIDISFPELPTE